jgi:probable F420-dependent oxidoreductase
VRFGFVLPNNWGVDPRDVVDLACEAEARGLHSVWVNHHVLHVGYVRDRLGEAPYHDPLAILGWAGAKTERIKLATSVLVLPCLHPVSLAKNLATLDQLSAGRMIVGVGVGGLPEEIEPFGVDYESRGAYTDESIDVMRALWGGERFSFEGRWFTLRDVAAYPVPHQTPLPVFVGGWGKYSRRRAVRAGQGWHPMATAADLAAQMPELERELDAAGIAREHFTVAPRLDISELAAPDALARYEAAGADQLVVGTKSADPRELHDALDRLGRLADATS